MVSFIITDPDNKIKEFSKNLSLNQKMHWLVKTLRHSMICYLDENENQHYKLESSIFLSSFDNDFKDRTLQPLFKIVVIEEDNKYFLEIFTLNKDEVLENEPCIKVPFEIDGFSYKISKLIRSSCICNDLLTMCNTIKKMHDDIESIDSSLFKNEMDEFDKLYHYMNEMLIQNDLVKAIVKINDEVIE